MGGGVYFEAICGRNFLPPRPSLYGCWGRGATNFGPPPSHFSRDDFRVRAVTVRCLILNGFLPDVAFRAAGFLLPSLPLAFLGKHASEVHKRGRPSKWPPSVFPQNLQISSVRFPYNSLEKPETPFWRGLSGTNSGGRFAPGRFCSLPNA